MPHSRMLSYHHLRYRPLLSAEDALDEANCSIEKNPIDVQAFLRRAKAFMRLGDYHAAHADLTGILNSLKGGNCLVDVVCVLFSRGVCNVKLSCIDQAIEDFTAALGINPSYSRSAYERAACHNRKGNFTAAILDYERALQSDVGNRNHFVTHRRVRSRFAKLRQQQQLLSSSLSTEFSLFSHVDRACRNGSNKKEVFAANPEMYSLTPRIMEETSKLSNIPAATPFISPERGHIAPSTSFSVCDSGSAELHHQRGLAYRKQGDLVRAIEEYTSAIQLDPKNFKALFNRGFCHDKIGDYDAAIRDYEAAMRLEPEYAYTYYNLGISYDRRGDHYEEAIAMFDKAIALDGSNADFYHNRGFSRRKLGNYREAVKDYTMSLALDPKHFKAYYNRAFCHDKIGDISSAIADYTSAIAIQDDNPNAYHNRGVALEKIGRIDDAIADYTRAIQLDDGNPFTFNVRGVAYDRIGDGNAALRDLTWAITLLPDNATFYQNRASVYQNMERFQEALQDYDTSVRLYAQYNRAGGGTACESPNTLQLDVVMIKIYNNCGFCRIREGRYEAAIQDFTRVIALDSDNLIALYNRGICYDKLGNHRLAVKDFTSLIALDTDNVNAYFNRGLALEGLEEYAMALDDYALALKLDMDQNGLKDGENGLSELKANHRAMVASQRVLRLLNGKRH